MGPKSIRIVIVVIAILTGIIVALVTGILVRSGGGSLTSVALSRGGSFAATVALVLTIAKSLDLVTETLSVWRGQILPCSRQTSGFKV